jgi:hypothetical protein
MDIDKDWMLSPEAEWLGNQIRWGKLSLGEWVWMLGTYHADSKCGLADIKRG